MPLVALAYLSFAAGLLTGFGGAVVPGLALVTVGALEALRRASAVLAGAVLAALAGLLIATVAQRDDDRCTKAAPRAGEWTVRLAAPAAPGAFVRGEIALPGC